MPEDLAWLQDWYIAQCDGHWEHECGIHISTLDNPGWRIEIDLAETEMSELSVARVFTERSEHDWIAYEVTNQKFIAHAGPTGLSEMLARFRQIATTFNRSGTRSG